MRVNSHIFLIVCMIKKGLELIVGKIYLTNIILQTYNFSTYFTHTKLDSTFLVIRIINFFLLPRIRHILIDLY